MWLQGPEDGTSTEPRAPPGQVALCSLFHYTVIVVWPRRCLSTSLLLELYVQALRLVSQRGDCLIILRLHGWLLSSAQSTNCWEKCNRPFSVAVIKCLRLGILTKKKKRGIVHLLLWLKKTQQWWRHLVRSRDILVIVWKDGSEEKSTGCSCRRSLFNSQHPHGGSTASVTPVPTLGLH